MPITKKIVEMMNGQIDVESEKGKGTAVILMHLLFRSLHLLPMHLMRMFRKAMMQA